MSFVYREFTREAIDAQYDTSRQLASGDVAPYFERFARESALARASHAHEADLAYGDHPRETLDFFPASAPGAPFLVWVHGGYWRRLSKNESSYVAPPIVDAGGAVAIVSYPLAPEASLDTIVASVARAFAFARDRAASLGCDPTRAYVGGHSVGAQLAATLAHAYDVRGLVTISGLYDLEPLRHTRINDWIAMDEACAYRNAPLHLPPKVACPLVVAAGGNEQAEFHRQLRDFVAAWRSWGGDASEIAAPGLDHFSLPLELARARSPLASAVRTLMGLD